MFELWRFFSVPCGDLQNPENPQKYLKALREPLRILANLVESWRTSVNRAKHIESYQRTYASNTEH